MIINAKFASVCPCCSKRIDVGTRVEWSPGAKAMHFVCATREGKVTASPSRTSTGGRGYIATAPRKARVACTMTDGCKCAGCRSDRAAGWE